MRLFPKQRVHWDSIRSSSRSQSHCTVTLCTATALHCHSVHCPLRFHSHSNGLHSIRIHQCSSFIFSFSSNLEAAKKRWKQTQSHCTSSFCSKIAHWHSLHPSLAKLSLILNIANLLIFQNTTLLHKSHNKKAFLQNGCNHSTTNHIKTWFTMPDIDSYFQMPQNDSNCLCMSIWSSSISSSTNIEKREKERSLPPSTCRQRHLCCHIQICLPI